MQSLDEIKDSLLKMVNLDNLVRNDLMQRGLLFDGYHQQMEEVHNANADQLLNIINEYGWPTKTMVGDDGTAAAWLIVQHAISKPFFQRQCLEILKTEVSKENIHSALVAKLEDRIHIFEGKKQIYGTQFDWDDNGQLSPQPIQDPEKVDALRSNVGLPPLAEEIKNIRKTAKREGNNRPIDINKKETEFLKWAKKVGWRK